MYKTIWFITDNTEQKSYTIKLTYYHFGKTPKFPSWYMEDNHVYEIEMLWNIKLIHKPSLFIKRLFHYFILSAG